MSGGWFDADAIDDERYYGNMEMAQLEKAGRRGAARRKKCPHRSHVSHPDGSYSCRERGDGCGMTWQNAEEYERARVPEPSAPKGESQ